MNKIFTLILIVTSGFISSVKAQNIPNGNFEETTIFGQIPEWKKISGYPTVESDSPSIGVQYLSLISDSIIGIPEVVNLFEFKQNSGSLKFDMKLNNMADDETVVQVEFLKWDAANNNLIELHELLMIFKASKNNWTPVEVLFKLLQNPDSVRIFIRTSEDHNTFTHGTRLMIDNMRFISTTGVIDLTNTNEAELYPNPANSTELIHLSQSVTGNYTLINSKGETVLSQKLIDSDIIEFTAEIPAGTYILQIEESGIIKRKRIIVL